MRLRSLRIQISLVCTILNWLRFPLSHNYLLILLIRFIYNIISIFVNCTFIIFLCPVTLMKLMLTEGFFCAVIIFSILCFFLDIFSPFLPLFIPIIFSSHPLFPLLLNLVCLEFDYCLLYMAGFFGILSLKQTSIDKIFSFTFIRLNLLFLYLLFINILSGHYIVVYFHFLFSFFIIYFLFLHFSCDTLLVSPIRIL